MRIFCNRTDCERKPKGYNICTCLASDEVCPKVLEERQAKEAADGEAKHQG